MSGAHVWGRCPHCGQFLPARQCDAAGVGLVYGAPEGAPRHVSRQRAGSWTCEDLAALDAGEKLS